MPQLFGTLTTACIKKSLKYWFRDSINNKWIKKLKEKENMFLEFHV